MSWRQLAFYDQIKIQIPRDQQTSRMDDPYFWFHYEEDFTEKHGWLLNIQPTRKKPKNSEIEFAAVNLFFMEDDGSSWRVTKIFEPYIYAMAPFPNLSKYHNHQKVRRIDEVEKIDIGGDTRIGYKITFANIKDLESVRDDLRKEPGLELREYDVTYYTRFCLDTGARVGNWYYVRNHDGVIELEQDKERQAPPQPRVLAFDIECSKEELQFPNPENDEIMMISYMVDGQGYLVTNKQWFSKNIESFEYSPLEFYCEFKVMNCENEYDMLDTWFRHIREIKPHIMVTFNGDSFDWPFVDKRAEKCGLNMRNEIGYYRINKVEETYSSSYAPHIDCFKWVQRDSYLPTGSHGLKAVTRAKLQYDPLELDPEQICPMGVQDPQRLANYSVSDAYATYYLFQKYVQPFIFSLTTVLPVHADDCLRRGTGTLCEALLMAQAYDKNIFFPNKSGRDDMKRWHGHLLISETYVGGRVECLQSGIFRDDIETDFSLNPEQYQEIIRRTDDILDFVVKTELKLDRDQIENFDEIRADIIAKLEGLRDRPTFNATPIIIHLDVAAMYPNIILTNRLQPTAIVTEDQCARCDKRSEACQRRMDWMWRGEFYPATEAEANSVLRQLESEVSGGQPWHSLSLEEQSKKYKQRLGEYCKRRYQKSKDTLAEPEKRESIICMKENSFYVDTVRSFRDRRYEFKDLLKVWNGKRAAAKTPAEREETKKMVVLYDSLQLAHKCLLNSFYGYVMRGGARWRSMEMAGVVTHRGATIIKETRSIVEGLGKGLELDTDGIWAAFPPSFPMKYFFTMKNGQKKMFMFPCSMLNHNVERGYSNHQYHELNPETGEWTIRTENSIYFELDGPYHAMFLPAAKEEGKRLKKRYAVFNSSGHITELKGFEIKRRGEWKMIKMLQSDAFGTFMKGNTNEEIYQNVASVCHQYLMVLRTKGKSIEDDELLNLMSESSTMSKSLSEYGNRKAPAATTAKRLADMLGESILEGKGLKCEYIISKLPVTESIAARAIPILVFQMEDRENMLSYLQKWCGDPSLTTTDFRDIIDWEYYTNRLYGTLQKILVIPAFTQGVILKDFEVPPPDWLIKRQKEEQRMKGQRKLDFAVTHEKAQITREKTVRDESEFTDYQRFLMNVKGMWRKARAVSIERPQANPIFKDWRVLEVRPSSQPGAITVFVQSGVRSVAKLDVDVPRVFYINSTRNAADVFQKAFENMNNRVREVKMNLPHRFPTDVITRFTLSETEFAKYRTVITSSFSSTEVHGVYETNVPALFRSLCTIGTTISKARKSRFVLTDLESKESKERLAPELGSLNKLFVYSCFYKKRGLFALVPIMADATSADAQIFMFYPHERGVNVTVPSIMALQEADLGNPDLVPDPSGVVKLSGYSTEHLQNIREAAAALQAALNKFARTESSVVLLESNLTHEQLLQTLKITALHQYPIITLDFQESDGFLDSDDRSPWQVTAIRNFTSRYLQLVGEIGTKMSCSMLLNTPIGNLHGDICMQSLDLLFARELKAANYIMWYSESSEPDIGGSYSNTLVSMPGDPFSSLSRSEKGAYLSRCVEYHLSHLSTSTIIGCLPLIDKNLPDHSVPAKRDYSSKPSLDAIMITSQTFEILSRFLSKLVEQCGNERNILSSMIGRIGTWLSSSSSVFYDPAIHSVFHHFLSQAFEDLVSYFNSKGLPVVYADQSKLILNVGTNHPRSALEKLRQEKPLLAWIDLEVNTAHDFNTLIWIDQYNFYGTIGSDNIAYEWNIQNFLTKKFWTALFGIFNDLLMYDTEHLQELFTVSKGKRAVQVSPIAETFFRLAEDAKVLPLVFENSLRSDDDITGNDFLLMVNTFFHVVEGIGDSSLRHTIQALRRNILQIIEVGEFDSRAKFVDPSLHLVVPSVICKSCLSVRDIDILRDEDILNKNWICSFCQQPYDVRVFERWIFEQLMRMYESYQTQDLRCTKCQKVQARKLQVTCEDGGKLKNTTSREELMEFMRVVQKAAEYHNFEHLKEVVETLMQCS